MTKTFSRRDFLKIAGTGTAAAAVLTGCGPASRYVTRRPYANMPEFNQTGQSTYYATTCRECPAGCGIIVRTMEGRAIKSEGNPNHPVSRGKICSAGLTSVQGLYNPDRVRGPVRADGRGSGNFTSATWDEGIEAVRGALQGSSDGIAFLLGTAPDHLFDLVGELSASLGAPPPVRYGSLATFESQATLKRAAEAVFGISAVPYFDLSTAEYVFAFGDILGQWLSPVAYGRLYGQMRQGNATQRGYLVVFEPHQTLTGANADEWVPIVPGSEGVLAGALARLVAEQRGGITPELEAVDIAAASQASGVPEERLRSLAGRFASSVAPLAIPGGGSLAHANGLAVAQAILNLNVIANNLGAPGGVFLAAADPFQPAAEPGAAVPAPSAPGGMSEAVGLVDRMRNGQVQVLFVHGANPLFELPSSIGFAEALNNVPLIISFASFPDETSRQADWILPDHTGLESWGYQRELAGTDRPTVSGMQPVVVPMYDTRATADVLLAAAAGALPYTDEVAFLQQKVGGLAAQPGFFSATDPNAFWNLWLQNGGWWTAEPALQIPQGTGFAVPAVPAPPPQGEADSLSLMTFTTSLGDGSGANRPWLQETPNPLTTVMWNSWISIHPETAARLGVTDDDVVTVTSPAGEVEAVVYQYPAIRPDTVAVPFGQGHTALGRFAEGRGFNPANLLGAETNEAGDLNYADVKVTIRPTGRKRHLSRLESKEGVYGEEFEHANE